MLDEVTFEVLTNEAVRRVDTQLADQQVDADDRQFFGVARAVARLPLGPARINPGVQGDIGHGILAVVARCRVSIATSNAGLERQRRSQRRLMAHFARRARAAHGHRTGDMRHWRA